MSQDVSVDVIREKIFLIRGKRVMLDKDLAKLYGVPTKRLNEQVKRNEKRFPSDFMYKLTGQELRNLRSQFATSSWGGLRYQAYVFTEPGVAMLSSVLNSERAIQVNIAIMRVFIQIREILLTHKELAAKIEALELKYQNHDMKLEEYDAHIAAIFDAIKQLMAPPPEPPKRRIGFHAD